MVLKELIEDMPCYEVHGGTDKDISGIAYDSRKVGRGNLFVAVKGERFNGHDFIRDAVDRGATAVVHEGWLNNTGRSSGLSLIRVKDSRDSLAYLANNFCGKPSKRVVVIGVTGTNGKTTTTYMIKSILEAWGREAGLIGTINYMIKDKSFASSHTTPEALEFQGLLNDMYLAGCSHVVTEVSSHALQQKRVDYTDFRFAVFTNMTREHLDYHITMEDYFEAKKRLFTELLSDDGTAVINTDDPYGKNLYLSLIAGNRSPEKVLTYGIESSADLVASGIENSMKGLRFKIGYRGQVRTVESKLIGIPNVYNILSAAGAGLSAGVPWDKILAGILGAGHISGRFERVEAGQDFLCVIDYAHTEDALERLIKTARELIEEAGKTLNTPARIITVFGCGGNRDRGKRPVMAGLATRLSDYVVITSDNPRDEDPLEIIRETEAGAARKNYIVIPDRRDAVARAVSMAESGDIVLIAGKGHEDYQEIKGIRLRFSDREEALKAIRSRQLKGE